MQHTLKTWLDENDISQSEAARRLKLSQATLSRTLAGDPPTLRNASKIVRGTNGSVTYEDLLGGSVLRNLWRYDGCLLPAESGVAA